MIGKFKTVTTPLLSAMLLIAITGAAALVQGNPYDTAPTWSRDGQFIYFYTYRHGNAELYRMTPDGENQTRITESDYSNWWTASLSDPDKLIVVSDRDSGRLFGGSNLFLLDIKTGDFDNLTNVATGRWAAAPSVATEKNIVLYAESEKFGMDMPRELKLLDLNTQEITSYPDDPRHNNLHPAVSADGTVVSYARRSDSGVTIYLNDLTGQHERPFLDVQGDPPLTSLSANGDWIVFTLGMSARTLGEDGKMIAEREVLLARTDGTVLRRLTVSASSDHGAVFSPDGKTITFASYRHGPSEIFAIDVEGNHERNITRTSVEETGEH
ncbi:TolB family protein [Kordiimonas aquimaris]|uniref:TolB family protein n=1 Tax=Kordiimonas aquimaris TaxID=707591 RepID=UPI0021D105B4|nr:hypothetical protein [Kordiimonas aquimaris]